jgi:hypothetical protein
VESAIHGSGIIFEQTRLLHAFLLNGQLFALQAPQPPSRYLRGLGDALLQD